LVVISCYQHLSTVAVNAFGYPDCRILEQIPIELTHYFPACRPRESAAKAGTHGHGISPRESGDGALSMGPGSRFARPGRRAVVILVLLFAIQRAHCQRPAARRGAVAGSAIRAQHHNAQRPGAYFKIPSAQVLEIGVEFEI
jgi:hypothetical protein